MSLKLVNDPVIFLIMFLLIALELFHLTAAFLAITLYLFLNHSSFMILINYL